LRSARGRPDRPAGPCIRCKPIRAPSVLVARIRSWVSRSSARTGAGKVERARLLADFDRYLDNGGGDLGRNVAGYRQTAFHLSDGELAEFIERFRALFEGYAQLAPGPTAGVVCSRPCSCPPATTTPHRLSRWHVEGRPFAPPILGRMELRIFTEPQQGASYDQLLAVARRAEEAGYGAFFRSDHYLKMGSVSGLPGPTDAWITLAGLARDTTRIRLGTLMTAATFRLPGPLAITVSQVDAMSGGRVEFGIGTGWYEDEHRAYGIPFPSLPERFDRLEEQLTIVTGLWQTAPADTFTFTGRYYTLSDSPALPKPVQSPRPPVLLGGMGKRRTPALAARYADEFNLPFAGVEDSAAQIERVRAACVDAGRDPATLRVSYALVLCCGRDDGEVRRRAAAIGRDPAVLRANALAGTPGEVVDKIGRYAALGGERIYLQVLDLADLDHLDLVAAEVMPQV
jgi:F420-dependent oxidoreductase-like protein